MEETTLMQLKQKCEILHLQREEHEHAKRVAAELWEQCEKLKSEIIRILEAAELERFDADSVTVFRKDKQTVSMPKEPAQRRAFFEHLREKGIFEDMVTINHQTLNAWFKREQEEAEDRGDVDYRVPGIDEVKTYSDLSVRKR